MTVGQMKQSLTKQEYYNWLRYFNHKQPDVTEIQLAVISLIASTGLGNKNAKLEDFLVSKGSQPSAKTEVLSSDEVQNFFGGLV